MQQKEGGENDSGGWNLGEVYFWVWNGHGLRADWLEDHKQRPGKETHLATQFRFDEAGLLI
jgi:hypothetical protein